MKPYSTDLRKRIVAAVKHEQNTPEQAATRYNVSRATVHRYLQLDRDLHNLQPATSTGRPRLIPPEGEHALRTQVEAKPDATLDEHRQTWFETSGVMLSVTAMHEAIKRLGFTHKKRRSKPANATISPARHGSR